MFTILLSILFTTNILAAPTPSNTTAAVPWNSLKEDKSLARFQSTLLNQTKLTFLNECYFPQLSKSKGRIPCSLYFDAILQLNSTDFVVQLPVVEKLLNEPTETDFCIRKHNFPAMVHYQTESKNISYPQWCGYMCLNEVDGTMVVEPICVLLAWMGDEIRNYSAAHAATSAVVVPPVSAANSTNSAHAESKAGELKAVETPSAETPEPAPAVKPAIISSIPDATANKQSKPNPDTAVKDEPTKPEAPNHKENVAAAVAAAKAIASSLKPVKGKPQPNPDTQEEEIQLKDLPIDKHESLPIDQNDEQADDNDSEADPNEDINPEENDDENEDFEMSPQKLKPKEPSLASPDDIEADQKSSQEIINSNYLSNTNHVTDPFLEESGSNFFEYFLFGMFLCIVLYVVYHNKSKILALLLEGRRADKGRGGRRKHTAAYRKLDSNLEEAITSSASGRITQIIY